MMFRLNRVSSLFVTSATLAAVVSVAQPVRAHGDHETGPGIQFHTGSYKGEQQSRAEDRHGVLKARLRVETIDGKKFTGFFRDDDAPDVQFTGQGKMKSKGAFIFKGVYSPEGTKGTKVQIEVNGFLSANSELAIGTYKLKGIVNKTPIMDFGNISLLHRHAPAP